MFIRHFVAPMIFPLLLFLMNRERILALNLRRSGWIFWHGGLSPGLVDGKCLSWPILVIIKSIVSFYPVQGNV